jgi:putative nucleotidyltransferase with HDIG domain
MMGAIVLTDVIRNVRDLPSLPMVVMEVLNSFEQPDVNAGELADKVSKDQALAAKTMRLANSSFYGLQRKVTTIQQAITILGFDSIRTLITAAAVTDVFAGNAQAGFDSKAFWRHSIGTALCAKMIARHLKLNQDYAFVSGLLHDIGKLVLATRFPSEYAEAMRYRAKQDCYPMDAERAVLGVDHAAAGKALAEYWKFPPAMQTAIGNHHAPEARDMGGIPGVVHVAEAIAHALGLTHQDDDLVPVVADAAWSNLHIEPAAFRQICRDTEAEFEEACQILVR